MKICNNLRVNDLSLFSLCQKHTQLVYKTRIQNSTWKTGKEITKIFYDSHRLPSSLWSVRKTNTFPLLQILLSKRVRIIHSGMHCPRTFRHKKVRLWREDFFFSWDAVSTKIMSPKVLGRVDILQLTLYCLISPEGTIWIPSRPRRRALKDKL